MSRIVLENSVLDWSGTRDLINEGEYLVIAGDESALKKLPPGNWVAGTTPYFAAVEGSKTDKEALFITRIRGRGDNDPSIVLYDENTISQVASDGPEHGFTILILPSGSPVHLRFAYDAPKFPRMYFTPIVGWVTGVQLSDVQSHRSKVGYGLDAKLLDDRAIALHVPLAANQTAKIKMINPYKPIYGPKIRFFDDGFNVGDCLVDGKRTNFATFLRSQGIKKQHPIITSHNGTTVNVSIQSIEENEVTLYAPVFAEIDYLLAEQVSGHIDALKREFPFGAKGKAGFSCNCILNCLGANWDSEELESIVGPATFGEVAYQLLNQTFVYMTLEDLAT